MSEQSNNLMSWLSAEDDEEISRFDRLDAIGMMVIALANSTLEPGGAYFWQLPEIQSGLTPLDDLMRHSNAIAFIVTGVLLFALSRMRVNSSRAMQGVMAFSWVFLGFSVLSFHMLGEKFCSTRVGCGSLFVWDWLNILTVLFWAVFIVYFNWRYFFFPAREKLS